MDELERALSSLSLVQLLESLAAVCMQGYRMTANPVSSPRCESHTLQPTYRHYIHSMSLKSHQITILLQPSIAEGIPMLVFLMWLLLQLWILCWSGENIASKVSIGDER